MAASSPLTHHYRDVLDFGQMRSQNCLAKGDWAAMLRTMVIKIIYVFLVINPFCKQVMKLLDTVRASDGMHWEYQKV